MATVMLNPRTLVWDRFADSVRYPRRGSLTPSAWRMIVGRDVSLARTGPEGLAA